MPVGFDNLATYPAFVLAFSERLKACLGSFNPPRSQNWLAEESGIPASTISRIISGDRNATPDVIESLAPVLGLEPFHLVSDTDAEERYAKSGEFVKRSMYDAVVGTLAEYETHIKDLESKLRFADESIVRERAELSRVHQVLAHAEHDRDRARDDNRRLAESNREYRAGLMRAVTEIANLQAKLGILREELATTKKSARAGAILAGVAAFSGVVTLASLLNKDEDPATEHDSATDEEP